jgi:hypothetical protein
MVRNERYFRRLCPRHICNPQKALSCQSLRKFSVHIFATIWLPFYLG